jgi:hypothetical protein
VYLVRRSRWAKELRAVEHSAAQLDDACMYLLTWEDLDDVLATNDALWAGELRKYLYRRGLSAFRGFHHIISLVEEQMVSLQAWSFQSLPTRNLGAAFSTRHLPLLGQLAARRHVSEHSPLEVWARIADPGCLPGLASLAARTPRFTR